MSKTGIIFNIQRFCLHDGDGIRTTVFFKGCNLSCIWCHNPESQSFKPQLMFYKDKCTGCGKCKDFCDNAFGDNCKACGKCADACRAKARQLCGYEIDSDEVMHTIERDVKFYNTAGGGVTFSGGEPMLQLEFLKELLVKCKQKGIHTAVETAGNVDFSSFEQILPYTDLFLYDIKAYDTELHKKLTGVQNERILQNALKLMERKANVLFRMPFVPGINDGELKAVSQFVFPYKLELMPYHGICVGKYAALDRSFETESVREPSKEEMRLLVKDYENVIYSE